MLARLVAVAVVALSPVFAMGQALVDRVPEDASIYIGWRGSDSMGPGWENSHLKGVIDASQLPQVFDQMLPQVIAKVAEKDQEAAQIFAMVKALGAPMWRHPTAICFRGLDMSNPQMPMGRAVALCDAGAEAPALLERVQEAVAPLQGMGAPVKVSNSGSIVAVSYGGDAQVEALVGGSRDPSAKTLAQHAQFKAAMAQVGTDPALVVYINNEALLPTIDQMVQGMGSPSDQRDWAMIRDAINLGGIDQVIYAGGLDGQDWSDRVFIAAPAPRSGIAALLDTQPLSDDLLRSIPRTATQAFAGNLDLARLVSESRTALGKADPRAQQQFDQVMLMAGATVGLDLQKDLLASLGSQWAVYNDPTIGGNSALGMVLINRPNDPARAELALTQLEKFANNAIRQQMQTSGVTITLAQEQVDGINLHYAALPFVTPTWAIKDGNLYAGIVPQVVVAAVQQRASQQPSILDNDQFSALKQRLGDRKASSFTYVDLPRTAANGYLGSVMVSRYLGVADLFGVRSPLMVVPTFAKLAPHLTPAGAVSWSDDAGWHARTITPFPGATALATDPGSTFGAMQPAMMMSVLLPSVTRARETANKIKCASNMRQIGLGCMIYAAEPANNGKFPPDLATLLATEALSAEVLLCPDSGSVMPASLRAGTQAEVTQWYVRNSDYVYLGGGLTNTVNSERVILYEKPQDHGDGMNLLFADGHVEYQSLPQAMQLIQQQQPNKPGAAPAGPRTPAQTEKEEEGL